MEIVAHITTKQGDIHIHFRKGVLPGDVSSWSPNYSTKEKIEVLRALQEYLKEEIEKAENE